MSSNNNEESGEGLIGFANHLVLKSYVLCPKRSELVGNSNPFKNPSTLRVILH
jgi:hypothetical protein